VASPISRCLVHAQADFGEADAVIAGVEYPVGKFKE